MTALSPCPFCGAPGKIAPRYDEKAQRDWAWAGECSACEVALDIQDTEAAAIAAWNRRAPVPEETRLRAEVASLRATLGHQPPVEGAEPIGCPIPGMCSAVNAAATGYRAGAEAMREGAECVLTSHAAQLRAAADRTGADVELHSFISGKATALEVVLLAIRALPIPTQEKQP